VGLWQLFRQRFLSVEDIQELTPAAEQPAAELIPAAESLTTASGQQQQQQQHEGHQGSVWSPHDERLLARVLTRTTLAASVNGELLFGFVWKAWHTARMVPFSPSDCASTYIHVRMCMCTHACVCVCVRGCVRSCVHACMCTHSCGYVCMYVCTPLVGSIAMSLPSFSPIRNCVFYLAYRGGACVLIAYCTCALFPHFDRWGADALLMCSTVLPSPPRFSPLCCCVHAFAMMTCMCHVCPVVMRML